MNKQLWLIRHAESLGNTGQWGGPDPRLSAKGKVQAAQIKGPVELLIVSPMKRTLETYLESRLTSNKIIVSELFRERMGGGKGEYRDGELVHKIESDSQFQKRVDTAIEFLLAQPESRIAIVSHWGFLLGLTKTLFGTPIHFSNAQVLHRQFLPNGSGHPQQQPEPIGNIP